MKSIILRDDNNKIWFSEIALILFTISFLGSVIAICLDFSYILFCFFLIFIISIICGIAGLFFKNQRHKSFIILFFEAIILFFICYFIKISGPYDSQPYGNSVFRTNARSIQLALKDYYSKWHTFPEENEINKVLIDEFGKLPIYQDQNTRMIKRYEKINANNYVLTFNNYKRGHFKVKNCRLRKNTDTIKLLR